MREQIEGLEHHADLAADGVQRAQIVGELGAVDDDPAFLMRLQAVDAADHGGFAGAGRAADHDSLLLRRRSAIRRAGRASRRTIC